VSGDGVRLRPTANASLVGKADDAGGSKRIECRRSIFDKGRARLALLPFWQGYLGFEAGSARLEQEENRLLVEQGAVCNRLGSADRSLNPVHCMGELNPLQG
jgi:hypothetical protein